MILRASVFQKGSTPTLLPTPVEIGRSGVPTSAIPRYSAVFEPARHDKQVPFETQRHGGHRASKAIRLCWGGLQVSAYLSLCVRSGSVAAAGCLVKLKVCDSTSLPTSTSRDASYQNKTCSAVKSSKTAVGGTSPITFSARTYFLPGGAMVSSTRPPVQLVLGSTWQVDLAWLRATAAQSSSCPP